MIHLIALLILLSISIFGNVGLALILAFVWFGGTAIKGFIDAAIADIADLSKFTWPGDIDDE